SGDVNGSCAGRTWCPRSLAGACEGRSCAGGRAGFHWTRLLFSRSRNKQWRTTAQNHFGPPTLMRLRAELLAGPWPKSVDVFRVLSAVTSRCLELASPAVSRQNLLPELQRAECGVQSAQGVKFLVTPPLHNSSFLNYKDGVRAPYGGKPVCNHD